MIENVAEIIEYNFILSIRYLRKFIKHQAIRACSIGAAAFVRRARENIDQITRIKVFSLVGIQDFDLPIIVHMNITIDIGNPSVSKQEQNRKKIIRKQC